MLGRNRPAAIAIAGQQHGLVVLDAGGGVLRPAKLWNDTESADDAAALVAALGADGWAAACGSVPVASFTITKLRWLRRCEPEVFRRVARVLLPHDWLTAQLTGAATTDRGDASGTGWWSPGEERYRHDLLALVDDTVSWDSMLPKVLGPAEPAGEWEGMVVGPGTGDNMAAALGLGLRPGDVALSLGTSGTAFCVSDHPTADATGTVAGFADATGRYLPLVCTLNATKVTDAVARLLGVDPAELDALALERPRRGRRSRARPPPRRRAHAEPSRRHRHPHRDPLGRHAREPRTGRGGGRRLQSPRRRRRALSMPASVAQGRVLLVGGGARSAAYRQVVADLTGRPVLVPDADELVARGAALQASAVLTGRSFDDVAAAWGLGPARTVDPDLSVDRAAVRAAYTDALLAVERTG